MTHHELHAELMRSKPISEPRAYSPAQIVQWVGEWNSWNQKWHEYLLARIETLEAKEKKMDAIVTQVKADFATLKTDTSAKLADFQAQLAAALNNPNLPADTKDALTALDADMTAFDATVKSAGTTPTT